MLEFNLANEPVASKEKNWVSLSSSFLNLKSNSVATKELEFGISMSKLKIGADNLPDIEVINSTSIFLELATSSNKTAGLAFT